jgi:hypothetical protein
MMLISLVNVAFVILIVNMDIGLMPDLKMF